jgi:hypothetical protein
VVCHDVDPPFTRTFAGMPVRFVSLSAIVAHVALAASRRPT